MSTRNKDLIITKNPKSLFAESIRSIRTNLAFASIDKDVKIIMNTSPEAGDGKSFVTSNLAIAYAHYVLSFIRGIKEELKDVVDFMKKNWVKAFVVSFLSGLFIILGFIVLVIPGIIIAIGLMFYQEVCADDPKMSAMDVIHKSWEITEGHKMDLFVMGLSFIGWAMLASLTFGILYIWLMPYMVVAFALAYEELKK